MGGITLNRIEFLAEKKKITDWQQHVIALDNEGKIKSAEGSAHFAFRSEEGDSQVRLAHLLTQAHRPRLTLLCNLHVMALV